MEQFFQDILLNIGTYSLNAGQLIASLGLCILAFVIYLYLQKSLVPRLITRTPESSVQIFKIKRIFLYILGLGLIIGLILILKIDEIRHVFSNENITIKISTIFKALLILQLARLLDWTISQMFIHSYYLKRDQNKTKQDNKSETEEAANRTVQWAVYIFAIVMILRAFQIDYTFWSHGAGPAAIPFRLSNIFESIIYLLLARLVVWLVTQLVLYGYYRTNNVNIGSQFAINQLLKYVVYVIAIIMAVENLGIQMTVIWGGLAALLVGVGLGLQQTFNDFFSGIILLFERSVEVGDVLHVENMVGTVKRIGLRASLMETRDNLSVIVPNSKLVTQNVVNWSHYDEKVRFNVSVGVAYGSDTQLIKKILLDVANKNPYVLDYPNSFVRFIAFADSSLNFELHFWSKSFMLIEDIKSDLRLAIDAQFREHGVTIPFPQRDIWVRSSNPNSE